MNNTIDAKAPISFSEYSKRAQEAHDEKIDEIKEIYSRRSVLTQVYADEVKHQAVNQLLGNPNETPSFAAFARPPRPPGNIFTHDFCALCPSGQERWMKLLQEFRDISEMIHVQRFRMGPG